MRKPIAVLVAACVCALAAAPAAAAKTAQFRVTAEGVQTNSWSSTYQSQGKCDSSGESHGTEVVRFASRKAARTTVTSKPYFHLANYQLPLRVRAKVTRHGKATYEPTPPECEGTGGGGGPAPKPDCGTKRLPWDLQAGYFIGKVGGMYLQHDSRTFNDPFKACIVGGVGFPDMLTTDTKNHFIVGKLKESRFFDSRVDTIVVHAAGKKVEKKPAIGIDRTATVDWKITFHRIEDDQ